MTCILCLGELKPYQVVVRDGYVLCLSCALATQATNKEKV